MTAFDYDDDGICYAPVDNCPYTANSIQLNSDGDTLGDACDNCPLMENENQLSTDSDSLGDTFAEINGDCDDFDPDEDPLALEICDDGMDNDCDGATDRADSDCP